jgi:uncharacterized OB-fold protein
MEFTERYVNTFFENLAKGRLMGQKCKTCGTYRLFPVPVCANCQGTDMVWTELSKKGKLLLFGVSTMPPERFAHLAPAAEGWIQLEEGPLLVCLTEGVDIKNPEKDNKRLPLDVDIEMREIAGNFIPVAKIRK